MDDVGAAILAYFIGVAIAIHLIAELVALIWPALVAAAALYAAYRVAKFISARRAAARRHLARLREVERIKRNATTEMVRAVQR